MISDPIMLRGLASLRHLIAAMAANALIWPAAAWSDPGEVVGVVERICAGTSGSFVPRPDGKLLPLADVRSGDEIAIANKGGCLWVRLFNNETMSLTKGDDTTLEVSYSDGRTETVQGTYAVPDRSPGAPGLLGNLFDVLAGMVTRQFNYDRQAVIAAVRGEEPLDLPLLWSDENYVVAGSRALALSWVGGEAPFAVEIGPEAGPPAIAKAGVTDRGLGPVLVDLTPGPWRLAIHDATGETVEGALTVVPTSELPAAPPDQGLEDLPEALREAAYAAWLAEQDDGRWMYEAYLRAGALAGEFAPAGYLERYLASGALWQ
jgi:hypothetical protein